MDVLSIAGIDLADLGAKGTVTKLGEPFDVNVRHRERSAGSSYVGASVDPRAYVLALQPAGAEEMNQDRLLAILNIPRDDELILRAVRPETPTNVVVARAAVTSLDIRAGSVYATLIAADPYWYAETPQQKSVTVEDDLIVPIPVAGGKRVPPKLRFRPTVQRTTGTANHGAKLRRRFTVTNNALTASLYRLPLRLDLGETDDEVAASKMLSSGNDVRVFHEGREIARTLVSHNVNGTTCKLWLILPSLAPGEATDFEIVYSNPQAGAPPVLAYPDLPPFTLSTSSNALWVYEGALTAGNAGKGGWFINASAAVPSLVDFEVPAAWRRALTLPAGPNRDDVSQRRWTSYVATGTKYMAIFDAIRYRGGVAALQDEGLADGIVLYHPLGISNVNVGLFIENRDSLVGGGGAATGKVMILGRDTGAQDWITLLEDSAVKNTTVAATNYAPAAPVRQVAFAVWPLNEREIPEALGADRFCQARWNTACQVTIDTTNLSIVETQTEEACYEVDLHVRTGSAPESDLIPPTHHLYLGGGNTDRNRRLTMRLNEHLVIDCDRRIAQIWNTALTDVVENVSAYAVAARKAGATGPQDFALFADPEWLPLDPDYIPFENASFEEGLTGWVEDHVTPEAIDLAAIDGLELFLFSPDITPQADNTALVTWPDSSGNGRDATQGTGAAQPTYQTNELNGHPVVRFDGVDDFLLTTGPNFALSNPTYTVVMLAKDNAIGNGDRYVYSGAGVGTVLQITGNDVAINAGTGNLIFTEFDLAGLTWHLHVAEFSEAASNYRLDGVSSTTSGDPGSGDPSGAFAIGANDSGTQNINMDLAALLIFSRALTTEEAEQIEGALALTFGLSATLPGAHPYDVLVDSVLDTAAAVSDLTFFSDAGQPGSDDGEFADVRGIAVDSQGRVFAADDDNERVQRFSPSLVYQIKTGAAGSGNGQFASNDGPYDVVIDSLDRPWVVDRGNARLQRFSGELVYQSQIRPPRYGYALKVQAAGSGNGQFANPRGLAVDANGDVWVADTDNERVQRFSSILAYEAQGGTAGSGNGQFAADNGAYDVAIDTDGHPWVVDRGNHRVQELDASAGYVSQIDGSITDWVLQGTFGSFGSGTAPNFNGPAQVATDSSGNVYVADAVNARLMKLTSSGAFVAQITGLTGILGVAVDSSGNIYVAQGGGTNDVKKYSSALAFQWDVSISADYRHIATDGTHVYVTTGSSTVFKFLCSNGVFVTSWGSAGSGDGQFQSAYGIATDGTHVYVADNNIGRIQKFTVAGSFVTKWGSPGSTDGLFSFGPVGLALDASGDVWAVDQGNDRLQRFSNGGTFQTKIAVAGAGALHGIGIASGDVLFVSDFTAHNVKKYDEQAGQPGTGNGEMNLPESLAIKVSSGRVYVADTGNDRIQYFTSAGAFEGQWGSEGASNGQFATPVSVAVNQTSGDVYVVDQGNDRVQRFSATGSFLGTVGSQGTGDAQFSTARAIAIHPTTGNVYVLDSTRDDIQEFSSTLVFQRRWGASGTGDGQLSDARGLAFNADGTLLYVSDTSPDRVQRFDLADYTTLAIRKSTGQIYVVDGANGHILRYSDGGVLQLTFGSEGSGDGQMSAPDGIAVNQDSGDVYVVDSGNDRVQQFTSAGVFVRKWGTAGVGNGQFGSATRITIHPTSGNVFVADSTRDDIQEFTSDGTFVQTIGAPGVGDGQFSAPSGLCFDDSGFTLYVADSTQERIQRFVSGAFVPVGTITARLTITESSAPASAVISRIRSEDRRPVGDQPAIGPLFVASTNSADLQVYPCIFWYDRLDGLLGIDTQVTNPLIVNTYAAQGALFRPPEDAYFYRVGAEVVDLAGGATGQLLIDDFRLWPDSPALSVESDNQTDMGTLVFDAEWNEAFVQ